MNKNSPGAKIKYKININENTKSNINKNINKYIQKYKNTRESSFDPEYFTGPN